MWRRQHSLTLRSPTVVRQPTPRLQPWQCRTTTTLDDVRGGQLECMAKLVGEDEPLALHHHGCPRYWRERAHRLSDRVPRSALDHIAA
jgi:hypothetical protein